MSDAPLRRASLRRKRDSFLAKMLVLSLVAGVVGSGLAALSTSRLMLSGRNNITAYIPDVLLTDAPGNALIMLTSPDGQPLRSQIVTIDVASEGRVVWSESATTDAGGVVTPSFSGLDFSGNAEVSVKGAGEVLTKVVKIETTTRIFLQTDKPIYQPGQTVHVRTLTFSGTSPLVSMENVTLEVSAPSGDRILRKTLVPDEYGIASYDYGLGPRLPLGLYKLKATVGRESTEKAFGVQRYVLPRFLITFGGMSGWYEFNKPVSGNLCVDYVFGENVQGTATVVARAYTGAWHDILTVSSALNGGCMSFYIPATDVPDKESGGYLELKATATDTAGHSETKTKNVPLSTVPILITALADTNVPGSTSDFYIIARWPDGMPVVNATVTHNPGQYDSTIKTDSRGVARVSFMYRGEAGLSVTVTKDTYTSTLTLGLRSEQGVKVVADKTHYEVGDAANILVQFSGTSMTDWVYYEIVARNFVISTGRLTLRQGSASLQWPIDPSLVPLAEVRVYKTLSDLTVSRDSIVFTVGTMAELQVNITTDKGEYKPGEDVRLDFRVTEGLQGRAAAIGVSIVDLAVYEVDERFKGLEDALKGEDSEVSYETQVIEYIYGERNVPPDTGAPLVVSPQESMADQMQSSLPPKEEYANGVQNTIVGYWWLSLLSLGLAGYVGLVFLGARNRRFAAIAVVLAIAVPSVISLGYLSKQMSVDYSGNLLPTGMLGGGTTTSGAGQPFEDRPPAATGGIPVLLPGGLNWRLADVNGVGIGINGVTDMIAQPSRVRFFFPETWYWNPSLIVGPDGRGNISIAAPDSITTWAVDAIASTKDAKFGSGNAQVKVFQEFFVEPDIPVAAVKNDTFDLPVSVFNYLSAMNSVNVVLQTDTWFTLIGPSVRNLTLMPNTVGGTYFTITAKEIGEHNLTIVAGNMRVSDAVRRIVRVDPRGTPMEQTWAGRLASGQSKSVPLTLRGDRVPGTESAFVRLQASMTAVVLDGAENYIQYVSGCGEQSMSTLNIDVLAFHLVSEGTSDVRMLELEQIVNQGIQHELQFLLPANNNIGRGIVWFPGDQDVHPWLTSWGLITFKDAIDAGFALDEKIISDMQAWLVSIQAEDGSWSFPEWGIYEFNNPILRSKQVATTAYIARALMYSGYPVDSPAVQKALSYVDTKVHGSWDDPYVLALSLIVLADGHGPTPLRGEITSRLIELKHEENGTVYWKSPSSLLSDGNYGWGGYYGEYDSRTSETTGYAVMSLKREVGITGDVAGGVEYLLSHRNQYGGFMSTQDTVVALQALIDIGSGTVTDTMDITIQVNGVQAGTTRFDASSKDLTYILDISERLTAVTIINISTSGTGSVLYQIALSQYLPWEEVVPPPCELCLDLTVSDTSVAMGQRVNVDVNLTYNGVAAQLKMVLLTVKSGVGLKFDFDVLDTLVSGGVISLYEIGDNSVLIYIQNVVKGETNRFSLTLIGSIPFQGTLEGSQAEDLYDPGLVDHVPPINVTVSR